MNKKQKKLPRNSPRLLTRRAASMTGDYKSAARATVLEVWYYVNPNSLDLCIDRHATFRMPLSMLKKMVADIEGEP